MIRIVATVAGCLLSTAAPAASCLIKVDGAVLLHDRCRVEIEKSGQFTIGGGPGLTYFAVVPPERGEAWWNEERGATHAHSSLGTVVRSGSCWRSDRATICVTD